MSEVEDGGSYEGELRTIQEANERLLAGFAHWLGQTGLREKTIKEHADNISFFAQYLVYYEYAARRLDEATSGAVEDFLEDWFPRKALWASASSMKGYLATFRKFFKWLGASGLVGREEVDDVLFMLKDSRDAFLRRVAE